MDAFRILWVEEDYLEPFEEAMTKKGYEVKHVYFVSDAVEYLKNEGVDLLLLDVMIPIEEEDFQYGFNADSTSKGMRTGLTFYKKYHEMLKARNIPVLVYTICGNLPEVKEEFTKIGLPDNRYIDKVAQSNINYLINHIEDALRNRTPLDKNTLYEKNDL
jgi:CheY-like chemotaxis protein